MGDHDGTDQALAEIRAELRTLSERVRRLEEGSATAAKDLHNAPELGAAREISQEIVLVISAAVAAFLGERAHIRQIRLSTSPAWAQQGRVSIQASHLLQR